MTDQQPHYAPGVWLSAVIDGTPAPQGSKKAVISRSTGRAMMKEQSGPRLATYRANLRAAFEHATTEPFTGPAAVHIVWALPRPKHHYGTGRNAERLRATAPTRPYPCQRGDIDKLTRAVLDSMTHAGVWKDDAQCVDLSAAVHWQEHGEPARTVVVCRDASEPIR